MRRTHLAWITPTHTLTHLDGIAWGSLLALGLHTLPLSRRVWLWMGLAAIPLGLWAAATVAGGTAFLDSSLAVAFAGAVLASTAEILMETGQRPGRRSIPPRNIPFRGVRKITIELPCQREPLLALQHSDRKSTR